MRVVLLKEKRKSNTQVLNGKLLLTVIGRQKSNFGGEFKLKLVTT